MRTHCMPEHHCDRCGVDCKNQGKLREHRRQNPPCEVQELDVQKIMPEIQDELGLRTRNPVKTDRITYWNRVYDLLFKRETRIERNIDPCKRYCYFSSEIKLTMIHRLLRSVVRKSRALCSIQPSKDAGCAQYCSGETEGIH